MQYGILVIGVGKEAARTVNLMSMTGIANGGFLALESDDFTASEHSIRHEIKTNLHFPHFAFIIAEQDSTGNTLAEAVAALLVRDYGILTIGITTASSAYAYYREKQPATGAYPSLTNEVDLMITIWPDQLTCATDTISVSAGFTLADMMMMLAIKTITEPFTIPGYICISVSEIVDMARNCKYGLFLTGEAIGEQNALCAMDLALNSPLLTEDTIGKASHLILHIVSGPDLRLEVIEKMLNRMESVFGNDTEVIWQVHLAAIGEMIRVSLILAGKEEFSS